MNGIGLDLSLIRRQGDEMICNRDCFNCEFPDCINDEISYSEMIESNQIDQEVKYEAPDGHKKKIRKQRGYDLRYYQSHREIIIQKQRNNLDKHSQRNREYYSRNVEKERQRAREKYLRKRERQAV